MNCAETWKDIPEFEGYYQASSLGRIRSVDRLVHHWGTSGCALRKGIILSPKLTKKGYSEVVLVKKNKRYVRRVHRLVALTFLHKPVGYDVVNHINEVKTDNSISNLEWCTSQYNSEAYCGSRIKIYQYTLDGNLVKIWNSVTKAATSVSGDKSGIQHCCKGSLKTYKGYIWTYSVLTQDELSYRSKNDNLTSVLQFSTDGVFINAYNSMSDAANVVGCNPSAISMACNGLRKTIKGYIWKKV